MPVLEKDSQDLMCLTPLRLQFLKIWWVLVVATKVLLWVLGVGVVCMKMYEYMCLI